MGKFYVGKDTMTRPISASQGTPLVLVTGAAGRIGRSFAGHAASTYRLRLMVLPGEKKVDAIRPFGEIVEADLSDPAALARAAEGIDACVHLAGNPSAHSTWNNLLKNNIVGTYNLFVAALAAQCKRVIFASSIHAVSGYPSDVQVKPEEPVNPGDVYGVSKCFGESLGRYMAEKEGMSVIALRIGAFQKESNIVGNDGVRMMDTWVSPRDLNQLLCKSIDAPAGLKFAIFHGLSNNRFKRLDISNARELVGYAPQDDASVTNDQLRPLRLPEQAMEHNVNDAPDPRAASGLREQLPPR